MRKKLGFLIALAISLNITTTCLADAAPSQNNVVGLTLEQAISNLENSNEEVKSIDTQIDAANKLYDWDKQQALVISQSGKSQSQYTASEYASVVIERDLTPLSDQQTIDDKKNSKDEKLNTIKFDLEKQYMKVLTSQQQIDNINKYIKDIDEQINQMEEKIKVGQATKDQVNSLIVKKNGLLSTITGPQTQMDVSLLIIKKYLNLDLNSTLNLSSTKMDFVKFDDTDIENRIISAAKDDYTYKSLQKTIELSEKQVDIYTKYVYDSVTEPMTSELTLQNYENQSVNTYTSTQVSLWSSYYNLKNKEDAVQTDITALEAAQLTYDKAKQSYEQGLTDKVTLDLAELSLDNQKVTTQDAINDYMISQEQFKYMLNGHASSGSIS